MVQENERGHASGRGRDDRGQRVQAAQPGADRVGGERAGGAARADKRGRPVAALVPVHEEPVELWDALRELMEPVDGVDLTAPVGEAWAAERD